MFRATNMEAVQTQVRASEKNYVIQKNDRLELEVYTTKGERLGAKIRLSSVQHQNGIKGGRVVSSRNAAADDNETGCRLMCAWDTAPETVDQFLADIRAAASA